jgi:hypothetical protein
LFKQQQQDEFDTYKQQLSEEFVAYRQSIDLEAGQALSFNGKRASQQALGADIEAEIAAFEQFIAENAPE